MFNHFLHGIVIKAGDAGKDRLDFYTGKVGQDLVEDIQELGGIISLEDMQEYRAEWVQPTKVSLNLLVALNEGFKQNKGILCLKPCKA